METITWLPLMFLILCSVRGEFLPNAETHLMNCTESDREALIDFKNGLHDPVNRLSSWKGSNCCHWRGISCENTTGAVIAIDLRNPHPTTDVSVSFSGLPFETASTHRYEFWNLSGEIKPSLTKLKSLRHLDLSFNTFNDNPIPDFFGSLKNLQYLNLSHAGFSGAIPLNLGNLSSLQYLDVSSDENWLGESSLFADNLEWLTGLVSLKHLVMNEVNLSVVGSGLIRQLNKLPSLTELHLENCRLSGSISPPTFLNLTSLVVLDLSQNQFDSKALDWFVNISSLVTLDISNCGLGGRIPLGFSELPNLQFLYLGYNGLSESCHQMLGGRWEKIQVLDFGGNDLHGKLPASIGNLTFLSHLDLSGNSVDGGIPSSIGKLCNLISLDVSHNHINETLPKFLEGTEICLSRKPFPILQSFDLSYNYLVGNLPEWLGHIENLVKLDLSMNYLNGQIPAFFGSLQNLSRVPLPSLQYLDLSDNYLVGNLPEWLCQLENLVTLHLGRNSLNGSIPACFGSLQNLSRRPLPNLQSLEMSDNQLVGKLPEWLAQLENLVEVDLSNNSLHGPIPTSFGILQQNLPLLNVGENELNGTLPESLGQLSEMQIFDVSSNHLTGKVTEAHFLKLKKLVHSDLSSNSFTLNVNSNNWVPPFQVSFLGMGSCHLGPSFPTWLKSQKYVDHLDFSNAIFSGSVPDWFWEFSYSLSHLNLSFNQLAGQLPSPLKFGSHAPISMYLSGVVVDFSSNSFSGSIPTPSGSFYLLNLSKNKLSGYIPNKWNLTDKWNTTDGTFTFLSIANNQLNGEIPAWIGNILPDLEVIDLSNNNLIGSIPSSIGNCSGLAALDLSNNHLSGTIPTFLGQLSGLKSLHLNDNKFHGQLPSSFQNLSSLETVSLGNNRLNGSITPWIGKGFESLRILSLRSNSFSGELPALLSNLRSIQILDLAENQLTGSIPASFGHFKAMLQAQIINRYLLYGAALIYQNAASGKNTDGYIGTMEFGNYYESFVVNMKGQLLRYTKTLSLVTMLDLSGNNLSGDLPIEMTNLLGLVVLNLSRNRFTGHIPKSISKLKQLSSLDLSSNRFSGGIPQSLGSLSFLGYLNLSNNELSGPIPYKDHMLTFDASSYAGNVGLCGGPLAVKCPGDDENGKPDKGWMTPVDTGNGECFIDKWFYLSIGLGFAAGILVPYLIMAMRKSWSAAYFDVVDKAVDRILYQWLKYRTIKQRTRAHQRRR